MYLRLWWKDARQFWPIWVFLFLAAAVTQELLLHFAGPEARDGFLVGLALCWATLYAFAVSAAAFAGERETGTLRLLDILPASRRVVWASKVSFAFGTTLVLAATLLAIAALGGDDSVLLTRATPAFASGPLRSGVLLLALILGLFCSSIMSNALLAAVASIVLVTIAWSFLAVGFDQYSVFGYNKIGLLVWVPRGRAGGPPRLVHRLHLVPAQPSRADPAPVPVADRGVVGQVFPRASGAGAGAGSIALHGRGTRAGSDRGEHGRGQALVGRPEAAPIVAHRDAIPDLGDDVGRTSDLDFPAGDRADLPAGLALYETCGGELRHALERPGSELRHTLEHAGRPRGRRQRLRPGEPAADLSLPGPSRGAARGRLAGETGELVLRAGDHLGTVADHGQRAAAGISPPRVRENLIEIALYLPFAFAVGQLCGMVIPAGSRPGWLPW